MVGFFVDWLVMALSNDVLCRYVRFGNFAKDTACFDAAAFKMADGEALALDPQARIALEQTQVPLALGLFNSKFTSLPIDLLCCMFHV